MKPDQRPPFYVGDLQGKEERKPPKITVAGRAVSPEAGIRASVVLDIEAARRRQALVTVVSVGLPLVACAATVVVVVHGVVTGGVEHAAAAMPAEPPWNIFSGWFRDVAIPRSIQLGIDTAVNLSNRAAEFWIAQTTDDTVGCCVGTGGFVGGLYCLTTRRGQRLIGGLWRGIHRR
jgi:hypothetical protein